MERLNVLYLDDDKLNLKLFKLLFKSNFNVVSVANGFEALEVLQKKRNIDLVISDWNMPEMDGLEFIRRAKRLKPHLPYYMLSSYFKNDKIYDALDSGLLAEYFEKPFNKELILKTVYRQLLATA